MKIEVPYQCFDEKNTYIFVALVIHFIKYLVDCVLSKDWKSGMQRACGRYILLEIFSLTEK